MKKNVVFLAVIAVMVFAVAALAAQPMVKVRVVNVSVLGEDAMTTEAGIAKTATMSLAENPRDFPPIESLFFTVGKDQVKYVPDVSVPAGALKFSGSITDDEMLEFISISHSDKAGKFDGAVVSRDGKITYLDEPIVIDYVTKAITTPKSFAVKDGDVLLLFVKDAEEIHFGNDKKEIEYHHGDRQPTDPTHNRTGKG
jgi:hypothetical protein